VAITSVLRRCVAPARLAYQNLEVFPGLPQWATGFRPFGTFDNKSFSCNLRTCLSHEVRRSLITRSRNAFYGDYRSAIRLPFSRGFDSPGMK
jgi:hypothetical protein